MLFRSIREGICFPLRQTPAVQGRFSVVYWQQGRALPRRCFFEKRSRKLHSFFLFLLYDMIEMKSIFEEGDCVLWLRS